MSCHVAKNYRKSQKYKGVYYFQKDGLGYYFYKLIIKGCVFNGSYKTEKEAAIAYDIKLIDNGKEPVNVLKRK